MGESSESGVDQRELWIQSYLDRVRGVDLNDQEGVRFMMDGFFKLKPEELLRLEGVINVEKLVFLARRQEGDKCPFVEGVIKFSNRPTPDLIKNTLEGLRGLREDHMTVLGTPYDTLAKEQFGYDMTSKKFGYDIKRRSNNDIKGRSNK